MANPHRLARGLASLRRRGPHYVTFTGGEPLLYPDLLPALAQARQLGLGILLSTNGALLTPQLIRDLSESGLDALIISLDAASAPAHDEHRGLPGLTAHIREMLPLAEQAALHPIASVTVSRLIDDLEDLAHFIKDLGFERLTFSYPLTGLASSYLGYADHELVNYSVLELEDIFSRILALKSRAPLVILNSRQGLLDLQRRGRGLTRRFPCLAGFKHFYVDWHLQVYRCHYLPHILGPLEDVHRAPRLRDDCDACTIECYRDASVFQHLAISCADALTAWRRGRWLNGLSTLLHPHNFLALTDLIDGRHWVQR
jgi:MoaA/NifB/PqqE/SkfB family radical SAM enzyme